MILLFSWNFGNRGSRFEIDVEGPSRDQNSAKIANWKTEIQGFPLAENSASEDITIKSYGDFEILQNSKNGLKIHKIH